MKRRRRKTSRKLIRSWKQARAHLERWRRKSATVRVELRRPRVIDAVPIDFLRGEPAHGAGPGVTKFSGRLIFFTADDVTIRRPSGAILVIDNYEIAAMGDRACRFVPARR